MKKSIIKIYILEILLIIFLFSTFLLQNKISRNSLSIFLFIYMIITCLFLKKRIVFSIHKSQVNLLMLVLSFVYLGFFYFFGLFSGFKMSKTLLSLNTILKFLYNFKYF